MLYKTLPYFVKELDLKTRTVVGIFAVHGNIDHGEDMSVNGSFEKWLKNGRSRVRFLWNHNSMNPPIASIKQIREVGRGELPEKVPTAAPSLAMHRGPLRCVVFRPWSFLLWLSRRN